MSKTPKEVVPDGEGLPSTEPAPPPAEEEASPPEGDGEPEPGSAYDQAVAFQPDPWDQLPADPEVRGIYLGLNGHINFFSKRRA